MFLINMTDTDVESLPDNPAELKSVIKQHPYERAVEHTDSVYAA